MPFCSVITCKRRTGKTNVPTDSVSFHRFPFDPNIKEKWVDATGRIGWIPTKNSTICSRHFKDADYLIKGKRNYLNIQAVPTVNISRVITDLQNIDPNISSSTSKSPKSNAGCSYFDRQEVSQKLESPPNSAASTPRKRKLRAIITTKESIIKKQRLQIKKTQAQNRRLKKKIEKVEDVMLELKEKFSIQEEYLKTLESTSVQVRDLIARQTIKKSTAQYSPALRSFALTLHYYSPKAYEYVRTAFDTCLPHPSTLRKWYQNVEGEPGFTAESFAALKLKSQSSPYPIVASLVLDEMAIRRRIEWDGNKLHGCVDIGNGLESDYVSEAKEALVFLVTAINGSWKVPVGFFLVDGVTGSQRAELLNQCLELLHETGIKIVSVTFDGCAANVSMLKSLQCSLENPVFNHPVTNSPIVCILDPSHMVKLIRNAFQTYKTFIDKDGRVVKWAYLEELNKLQETERFHLANKLRFQHLNYHNQKMKVKLATQLFSSSVAGALDFCRKDLNLSSFRDSAATAEFLQIINNLFDIFNSRSIHNYGYKKAINYKNASHVFDYIDRSVKYISLLKCQNGALVTESQRKIGFIGFLNCAKAIKLLYETLIITGELKYLPFYKFSQDHLEHLFGNIRSHGGANNNPTARQFKSAYKKLLIHIEIKDSGKGNCTALENISILNCSSAIKRINATCSCHDDIDSDHENSDEDCDTGVYSFVENLSDFSAQIISYIAGNIVHTLIKKLKCDICIGALISHTRDSIHNFIVAKDKGGLLYPSKDVIKVCQISEGIIRTYYIHGNSIVKLEKNVLITKILRNFIGTNIFDDISFHQIDEFPSGNHVTDLIKAVAEKYINIRLHFILKTSQKITKRQKLNKYILFQGQ